MPKTQSQKLPELPTLVKGLLTWKFQLPRCCTRLSKCPAQTFRADETYQLDVGVGMALQWLNYPGRIRIPAILTLFSPKEALVTVRAVKWKRQGFNRATERMLCGGRSQW